MSKIWYNKVIFTIGGSNMSKRVYELASLLGVTNDEIANMLLKYGFVTNDYVDYVDDKYVKKLENDILVDSKSTLLSHNNKSSLKFIEIIGLFNKKDYKISFQDDINLFIAENGCGKTTILNIIIAVLKGDKKKLRTLPFEKVIVTIENEKVEISKKEMTNKTIKKNQIIYIINQLEDVIPNRIIDRINRQYYENGNIDYYYLLHIIRKYARNSIEYRFELDELMDMIYDFKRCNANEDRTIDKKIKRIRELLKEEVLEFPTYRRIEEEIDSFISITEEEKRRLNNSTINFGMDDVEKVITKLTNKLKEDAINSYSIMNGEVLDDLLDDKLKLTHKEKVKIDKEIIKIIIGRVGKNRIKRLDKLMDFVINDVEVANKTFLEYYLFKLINIYEAQKPIDDKIKKFIYVCNSYLVNKEIVYDEVRTEVMIEDKEDRKKISFQNLSSGEKQILSLFCKIYLNTSKQVIFIIDEPELSLSIIWQKKLIEDIYNSGKIALLIATTHSPYIFKNKYRCYAKELSMFEEKSRNGK